MCDIIFITIATLFVPNNVPISRIKRFSVRSICENYKHIARWNDIAVMCLTSTCSCGEWWVTERWGPRASVKRDMSHKHETYEFYIYRWLSPYSRILSFVTYFLYRYVYRTYVSCFVLSCCALFILTIKFQPNIMLILCHTCKLFFSLAKKHACISFYSSVFDGTLKKKILFVRLYV